MDQVWSLDGTAIAVEQQGAGPVVVLVGGALQHRALDRLLGARAAALAQAMTGVAYDRRGRGDSGDTPPYAVVRDIEDLAAVIDRSGGPVTVLGLSSGGALALEAASLARGSASSSAMRSPITTIRRRARRGDRLGRRSAPCLPRSVARTRCAARQAYHMAIDLERDLAVRRFLEHHHARLGTAGDRVDDS